MTLRGDGKGGRNQEFAFGSRNRYRRLGKYTLVLSAGTDGTDGPHQTPPGRWRTAQPPIPPPRHTSTITIPIITSPLAVA